MNAINRFLSFAVACTLLLPGLVFGASLPDFREIVQEHSPAVVKIVVQQGAPRAVQGQPGPEQMPEYLRRFF
jgi:serine protease Do